MITIFKKWRKAKQRNWNVSDILTGYLNDKLQQFAVYLSEKTHNIQPRRLAIVILTFCVAASVALSVKLLYSFKHKTKIHLQSISAPLLKPSTNPSVDAIIIHRIKNVHHQLDSLKRNDSLRYDSIMQCRPHLLDSIIMVERLGNY